MYLYVILSSVPGSSFSQIKATLSGSFATCTSKQFTVNHKRNYLLLLTKKLLFVQLQSMGKCNVIPVKIKYTHNFLFR